MKIISLEGIDKAGKATQTHLLADRLRYEGYTVLTSDFHRYDTPTGELIRKWLTGEWEANQHTIELIMAADKQAQQDWFQRMDGAGLDFLILDRYTSSQIAYAIANDMNMLWICSLLQNIRQPDIEVLIDIPARVSMERKGKFGENDRYESDLEFLQKVRRTYHILFSKNRVDGMDPVNVVHRNIWEIVQASLPSKVS